MAQGDFQNKKASLPAVPQRLSQLAHGKRMIVLAFVIVYLLSQFTPAPVLAKACCLILILVMFIGFREISGVSRAVSSGLFLAGILLFVWQKANLGLWMNGLLTNAGLVLIFICAPLMAMPFFYDDYQEQLLRFSRRYLRSFLSFSVLISVCSHFLGVLISMGALNLVHGVFSDQGKLYTDEDYFSAVLLRSYCLGGFWGPSWASVILITSAMGISWLTLVVCGVSLSVFINAINLSQLAFTMKRHPQRFRQLAEEAGEEVDVKKLWTMLGLAVGLIGSIMLLAFFTDWPLPLVIPLVSLAFPFVCALFQKKLPVYKEAIIRYYKHGIMKIFNQVNLYTAAGFLGVALSAAGIGKLIAAWMPVWLTNHTVFLCMVLMLLIILPSLAGVHAIVTGSALVLALDPVLLGLHPLIFALTILAGWLLSVLASPFSGVNLLAAGLAGCSSWHLSLSVNGRFSLVCMVIFSILFAVIN